MLKYLQINNYILINKLEISPSKSLNIITGETGAGKSILLGAIKLLMGLRYDGKSFLNKEKKCIIEGVFDIKSYKLNNFFIENNLDYEEEIIVRREINIKGKSRIFVNDTPINLTNLKILMNYLIDFHSQYDNFLIKNSDFQLNLLDIFANNKDLRKKYKIAFDDFEEKTKKYNVLLAQERFKTQDLDYKKFLVNELYEADLENPIFETLETEVKLLDNSEFLKQNLNEISSLLENENESLIDKLKDSLSKLNNISNISQNYKVLSERLESNIIELSDIYNEILIEQNRIEVNPALLEELKSKLDNLNNLQNKHKVNNINLLKDIQNKLEKEITEKDDIKNQLKELSEILKEKEKNLLEIGEKLSKNRNEIVESFKNEIEKLLKDLDMKNARIQINLEKSNPNKNGIDNIKILFSANKGSKLNLIEDSASGGEISRLMFCFKYLISGKINLPTIIFDEIDTGISGEIALKMASMMKRMSKNHQIIAITHLPQIAVSGDKHYFIYKDDNATITKSYIKELINEDRKIEIAKMIGGDKPSNIAIKTAEEMLRYPKIKKLKEI